MNIFLKIYLIETVVSYCILLSLGYRDEKREGVAHRQAIVNAFLVSFFAFIPIISLMVSCVAIRSEVLAWVKNDPTLPENQPNVNPAFKVKEKKEKKVEPINDRFEVMDL